MNRFAVILIVLLAAGLTVAWYVGLLGTGGAGLSVDLTVYDTDASGQPDMTLSRIGEQARTWHWDRDRDGTAEVIAYDAAVDADGNLSATGTITAWDYGGDGILEEGEVPRQLQELLRGEAYAAALAAAGTGAVELVDARVRDFVQEVAARYNDWRLSGFRMPILGAQVPSADRLLPGAPRAYRFGVHQGFDMYPEYIGAPTAYGGPVIAAKSGTVLRSDTDYVEMSPETYDQAIATSRAAGTTPPAELDMLRGRQIWIDHGHGVQTRYCHLSGIAPGVNAGSAVEAGAVIAFVGNSGMESATRGSRSGAHLHFELRVDDRYLGEGMPAAEIRALMNRIFGLEAGTDG